MKWSRNCAELIILIAIVATVYTQRVGISQWFREMIEPPVPEAVGYEEVKEAVVEGFSLPEVKEVGEAKEADEATDVIPNDSEISQEIASSQDAPRNDENVLPSEFSVIPSGAEGSTAIAVLPFEFNLAVPFTSQAPHANWDLPYKETCEEASLYMVHAYYEGMKEGKIVADTADAQIKKIIEFEKELFGYYEDTTAEQIGTLAEMMYGHEQTELIENPTIEQIKTHIAEGHPVIVPAAGRLLNNPNFTAPGPIYHMLVIRGYTKDNKFITNDPGTKNGEAYVYDFDTVMNAMHDWNNGAEITEGKKVVLIIYP